MESYPKQISSCIDKQGREREGEGSGERERERKRERESEREREGSGKRRDTCKRWLYMTVHT